MNKSRAQMLCLLATDYHPEKTCPLKSGGLKKMRDFLNIASTLRLESIRCVLRMEPL